MRRFAKRRSIRRGPSNLQWSDVSVQWSLSSSTTGSANVLIQLQSPANLSNLTADPPEDLTILRVVGDFRVVLTGATPGASWTFGLIVADVTWTPGATFTVDADKRILWHQTFVCPPAQATNVIWDSPGWQCTDAGNAFPVSPSPTHLDISPRVKVESGKALYLVSWENSGAASAATISSDMRVLYKRTGR